MTDIFLAKQKIFNINGKVVAYELLFRDSKEGIKEFPTNMKATSTVLLNTLTRMDFGKIVGPGIKVFINVDEEVINSNILEILDHERFVIEILETTNINPEIEKKLAKLKKIGFELALDDFDCSPEMIKKFKSILKYISIVKIDMFTANKDNLKQLMPKFKEMNIKVLAEKIESKEEHREYMTQRFDMFQGYHLHKPEIIEASSLRDLTHTIILKLISLIKSDAETSEIERFIRQKPDLTYNLMRFINNQINAGQEISSMTQIITMMGRDKLIKWLMLYIYSEVSDNELAPGLLKVALKRAESMEKKIPEDKDRAFIVGMFSMLDSLFQEPIEDILEGVKIDQNITFAVKEKGGPLGIKLNDVEQDERELIKEAFLANYKKIPTKSLIDIMVRNGISF